MRAILTKSNFRKNKGTSVGLFLLMILTAMLIGIVLLLFLDAYPSTRKEAERLDSGDGIIMISQDVNGLDDDTLAKIFGDDVSDYEIRRMLDYGQISIPFGDGTVMLKLLMSDLGILDNRIGRVEVVKEDTSINDNYLYLPYQLNTSGGFEIGDSYTLELAGKKHTWKVRGFVNTTYSGCNNVGSYLFITDNDSYRELYEQDGASNPGIRVTYYLKDGVKTSAFEIRIANDIKAKNPVSDVNTDSIDMTILGKTFMALILAVSFFTITVILVLVIMLMLKNSITNYIRENMKSIGALKAVGYTSGDIRSSLYRMFLILAVIGGVIGSGLSYLVMPSLSKMVTGQSGVPYEVGFNIYATVIPVIFVIIFTYIVTRISSRKIKKIEAIVALRDGMENHNFRKNRVRLEKSVFGLNTSLAFKTTFGNLKQNIITFFVTGLLIFVCTIGVLMYDNFNIHPNLEMIAFETFGGQVTWTLEDAEEGCKYLEDNSKVENIRRFMNMHLTYKNEETLFSYITDDTKKLNHKSVIYDGELPVYDNEVAVSGKFADDYGMKIGDEVELKNGDKTYNYLITGLIQTVNNLGREVFMSEKAASHIVDFEGKPVTYAFDAADRDVVQEILDDCTEHFGDRMLSTLNFYDVVEGSAVTFRNITTAMLITVCVIAGAVIMLILFLMVRTLIYNKRKDYGIYKAVGFTSKNLIFQTAFSFMPTIILSVVIFSFVSYFSANPYMGMIMRTFGLVRCTFTIPVEGMVIVGVGLSLLAFAFALFMARRIRKIHPYEMIVGE